jgi:putative DNA primase/helicase
VIYASELDRDPYLLGVANGVVCLRTGSLRPDSKSEYILRRSTIDFNPAASTFHFAHFITEVTCCPDGFEDGKVKPKARPTLARHLQKVGGYCLTGEVKEQVLFMLCGTGANGKSLFVDLLREVLGDYGEVIQPEILLAAKGSASAEQASPSTRKLAGARCAITSESKEGAKLDVAVVKRHTGDSKMTARGLYERPITFDITHKLVLLTNHPPRVDHMDDAIKGRIQVIPFDMRWNRPSTTEYDPTLPDADKDLFAKLKADAEGVLLYLIQGAVFYIQEGLTPPSEVKAFTQNYIASQDTVRRWVAECETCPTEEGLTAKQLLESYREYCAGEGEVAQVDTAEALGRRLVQLGFKSRRTRAGSQYGLKPRVLPDLLGFEIMAASGQQPAVM